MIIIGLDPRVEKLKQEFFQGKKCTKCGRPAERWVNRIFTCHDCSAGKFTREEAHAQVTRGTLHLERNFVGE